MVQRNSKRPNSPPAKLKPKFAAFSVEVAESRRLDSEDVARVYFQLGRGMRFDWLRARIEELEVEGRWQAMARGTLRENVARQQRALLETLLRQRGADSPEAALIEWMDGAKSEIARIQRTLEDMRTNGSMDFATLSVAIKEIERLIPDRRLSSG